MWRSTQSAFRHLGRLTRGLAQLVLPGHCCLCQGEVAGYRDCRVVCHSCLAQLSELKSRCLRCSAVVTAEDPVTLETCPWCFHLKLPFDQITAVANYEKELRQAVLRAKTSHGISVAWDLGQLLAQQLAEPPTDTPPPVVVPVPMHWTRRLRRGMSTAEVLAQSISRARRWPYQRLVTCRRRLQKQSELSFTARQKNVRNAFRIRRSVPADNPILLVDDIMTTGATLSELSRIFRRAGAGRVDVAVVARSAPEHLNV